MLLSRATKRSWRPLLLVVTLVGHLVIMVLPLHARAIHLPTSPSPAAAAHRGHEAPAAPAPSDSGPRADCAPETVPPPAWRLPGLTAEGALAAPPRPSVPGWCSPLPTPGNVLAPPQPNAQALLQVFRF